MHIFHAESSRFCGANQFRKKWCQIWILRSFAVRNHNTSYNALWQLPDQFHINKSCLVFKLTGFVNGLNISGAICLHFIVFHSVSMCVHVHVRVRIIEVVCSLAQPTDRPTYREYTNMCVCVFLFLILSTQPMKLSACFSFSSLPRRCSTILKLLSQM